MPAQHSADFRVGKVFFGVVLPAQAALVLGRVLIRLLHEAACSFSVLAEGSFGTSLC